MKRIARCPLCQVAIRLGPEGFPHRDEEALVRHTAKHSLAEWINTMQDLRREMAQQHDLRAMPRCAMPRA